MALDKLRYLLTDHTEKYLYTYENLKLLIHPSVTDYKDLLNKLEDDIELMPEIERTDDNTEIKFYSFDYDERLYSKSELLAFIFASISNDWNVIKGVDLTTGVSHFWLKHDNVIYDPSLAIITNESIYSKKYKQLNEIKNEEVSNYVISFNNLSKFYDKAFLRFLRINKNSDFSINFINKIIEYFSENMSKEYILNQDRIEHIKKYFMLYDFMELRQVLTQKRKSYLKSSNIAIHPSIDESILVTINESAKNICDLMQQEYDMHFDYYNGTLGNLPYL